MDHNCSELGRRIASLRKEKGYTQEKIGDLLNVTPQAISKWEQGNSFPDTLLLPPLARLLGVSIDYLLTGESFAGKAGPYDGAYLKEEFYWGIQPSELAEQITDILQGDTENRRLLDIGSGEGRDAIYFAKCGFQVDALEISAPGVEKIKHYSRLAGYAVHVLQADMIGYNLFKEYDVIYSCGSLQFLPLEERRKHFDKYKQHTCVGGLNVHLVFWEILRCEEQIIDCNSAGIPHQHAVYSIIARKIEA